MNLFLSVPIKSRETMKIECNLFSPNKATSREIVLLIDTGASRTAISRKQLQALKYTNIKKDPAPKRTVSGLVYLDMVKVSYLAIGGEFAFSNFNINLLDWEDSSFHGIIGMDILSQVYFKSDKKNFVMQREAFQGN